MVIDVCIFIYLYLWRIWIYDLWFASGLCLNTLSTSSQAVELCRNHLALAPADRSICIHRSYGIKYTRHVHESDICHGHDDVSINGSTTSSLYSRAREPLYFHLFDFFFSTHILISMMISIFIIY